MEETNIMSLFDMDEYSEDMIIQVLNKTTHNEQLEFFKILEKMYYTSKTKIVEALLERLFMDDTLNISSLLRVQIIFLFEKEGMTSTMMNRVYELIEKDETLEAITKFDVLKYVFREFKLYTKQFLVLLNEILCSHRFEEDFRYRSVLDCKSYVPTKEDFTKVLETCFNSETFMTRNKILMCQYMMNHPHHYDHTLFSPKNAMDFLIDVLTDTDMNDEFRMDVADIFLNMEDITEELRDLSIQMIDDYGKRKNRFSFYHNQENIHYVDTSSIQKTLDHLNHAFPFTANIDRVISQIKLFQEYLELNDVSKRKINVALIRIQNDRSCYGSHQNSLSDILTMIFSFIIQHRYSDELKKRMMEELIEMSGKCATGYVIRLVNILSGFDDNFKVVIPIPEAMKSVLYHRLNTQILEIQDEDIKNDVLYELTLPSSLVHQRPNFLKFFREIFPQLKEDLYSQFKDQLTDTDFDLYLKRIVINYEGYSTE